MRRELPEKQNRTGTSVHAHAGSVYTRRAKPRATAAFRRGFREGSAAAAQQMESMHGDREPSPEEAESKEVQMLREMMLRNSRQGEESQVSDELLRSNDQRQQDEVLLARVDTLCKPRWPSWIGGRMFISEGFVVGVGKPLTRAVRG